MLIEIPRVHPVPTLRAIGSTGAWAWFVNTGELAHQLAHVPQKVSHAKQRRSS